MEEVFKYLIDKIMYLQQENKRLDEEHFAICEYLREKGIDLIITRNKITELKKEGKNEC